METMKAVVKYALADEKVELRDVPVPAFGADDVLLRVKAAGVCGSDIEMWRNHFTYHVNTPVIQGHEFCGVIESVGADVHDWKPGDRVVSETSAYVCGHCRYCRSGDYNMCPSRLGYGYGVDGAFAGFVRVRQQILHRIPNGLAFEEAAITEPACVAYNSMVVRSRVRPGDVVIIIGPGPIGLNCLQMADRAGAGALFIAGTPVDEARFRIAAQVCPRAVALRGSADECAAAVLDATDGLGADLVVDAAGNSEALRLSMTLVRRLGTITKIGWGPNPVGFSLDPLITKAVTLQGSYGHNREAWDSVIRLMSGGVLKLKPLISRVLPLEKWREGYEAVESRQAAKVILKPE